MCYRVRVEETSSLEKHIFAFFLLFQVATKILFLCQSDSPVKSMHVNRWVLSSKCENSAGLEAETWYPLMAGYCCLGVKLCPTLLQPHGL